MWWVLFVSCDSPVKVSIRPVMLSLDRRMTQAMLSTSARQPARTMTNTSMPFRCNCYDNGGIVGIAVARMVVCKRNAQRAWACFHLYALFFLWPPSKGSSLKWVWTPTRITHISPILRAMCYDQNNIIQGLYRMVDLRWYICYLWNRIFGILGGWDKRFWRGALSQNGDAEAIHHFGTGLPRQETVSPHTTAAASDSLGNTLL